MYTYSPKYKKFYDRLGRISGMSNEEIDMFLLRMIKIITNDLNRNGSVLIPYLGKFTLQRIPSRKRWVVDFPTKKRTIINEPARDKLKFKVNREFAKLFR